VICYPFPYSSYACDNEMSMRKNLKNSPEWGKRKERKRLMRKGYAYTPDPYYARFMKDRGKEFLLAPKNFSMVDNATGVTEYFHSVQNNAKAHIPSVMDMSDIEMTDLATISLLISVMMDRRTSAKLIKEFTTVYIPPRNTEPGKLFRQAQFHETVTAEGIADHTFFLSRLSKRVNKDYIRDILNTAEAFLRVKNPGQLSPLLVEMISNTNNHANPDAEVEKDKLPWFFAMLENKAEGKIIFSLVDLGVGIYESLHLKGLATTAKFDESIKSLYQNSQSTFLRTNIPKGVDSSTGLPYRGKGLQSIYDYAKNSIYKEFKVITNRAQVDLKHIDKAKLDLGESLEGTIYYWEMSTHGKR